MSVTPADLHKDYQATLWCSNGPVEADAREEGVRFKEKYFNDAQFVFSRVQHHFHKKTKDGYVPLPRACLSKRSGGQCKHEFPMTKRLNSRRRVVCRGNAKKFGLRVTGKRNRLGLPLNRRTCIWQSGTAPALAAIFRSNSHTAPNYRLPPDPAYHDDENCKQDCGRQSRDLKAIMKLGQRAQREATGYYCGYTFKRQPVGRYELKATAQSLNFVRSSLTDKRPGQQWHRVTQKMVSELHQRCVIRTAPKISIRL